jgi:hypothetical protein
MKKRLYDEYLRRLFEVNDESKTDDEHRQIEARFRGWLEGVEDAAGYRFNGDYYYIKLFDSGKMQERPLCCGVFLDWKSNNTGERPETRSERTGDDEG